MKIVFLDRATIDLGDVDFSRIENLGEFVCYDNTSLPELSERAAGAEVLISNKVKLFGPQMEKLSDLRLISVIATGYNNIDTAAAAERNIAVANVAGYAVNTVPQHTFSLILALATGLCSYSRDVRAGEWPASPSFTLLKYNTFEIHGKTLGVIGYGSIGQRVARLGTAFGMKILVYDPSASVRDSVSQTGLDELLAASDIVTIHCPLTPETENLISARELNLMKKEACIINTARGGIINEADLARALNSGRIAGAGLDVLSKEPPEPGNPLLTAENVIITPHSAWSTREARQKLIDETALNIRDFFKGIKRNRVV